MAATKIPNELSSTPGIVDGSNATAITIDSSENVGIGLTNPSDYYATELVVDASDEGGISVVNGTTEAGYLAFADGTSGAAQYTGYLSYDHNVDALTSRSAGYINFMTGGGTERVRIDSSGHVGIGTVSPTTNLSVTNSGFTNTSTTGIPAIRTEGAYGGAIGLVDTKEAGWYAQDSGDTLHQYVGRASGTGASSSIVMTYKSSGKVGIGESSPTHTLHAPTARLGEEKWLNSVNAYYISSGTINRNLTINLNGSAEYYIIIYLVGLWPYTASGVGTRIVEVAGYGSTGNYHSVISNGGAGGQPTSVTVTSSGGNLNLAINYNSLYRWNASAKVVYGANGMTMSVDGTNG